MDSLPLFPATFRRLYHSTELSLLPSQRLGVQLQSTRSGRGAYVSGFYRDVDGGMFVAERSGTVLIGDLISTIDGDDVLPQSIDQIQVILLMRRRRQVSIGFSRIAEKLSMEDFLYDAKLEVWLDEYFANYCCEKDAQIIRKKLCWCRLLTNVEENIDIFAQHGETSDDEPSSLSAVLQEIENIRYQLVVEDSQLHIVSSQDDHQDHAGHRFKIFVKELKRYLYADISVSLLMKFQQSNAYSKMCAWIVWCPKCPKITVKRLLRYPAFTLGFYLHLAQTRRC